MTSESEAESKPPTPRKSKRPAASLTPEQIGEIVDEKVRTISLSAQIDTSTRAQTAEHKRQIERDAAIHKQQLEIAATGHAQRLECDEAIHRRWKEKAVMGAGGLLGMACLAVILLTNSSDDLKKAALAGVFALFTAALGFAAGKGGGKG
jgi:hypothetical protein